MIKFTYFVRRKVTFSSVDIFVVFLNIAGAAPDATATFDNLWNASTVSGSSLSSASIHQLITTFLINARFGLSTSINPHDHDIYKIWIDILPLANSSLLSIFCLKIRGVKAGCRPAFSRSLIAVVLMMIFSGTIEDIINNSNLSIKLII